MAILTKVRHDEKTNIVVEHIGKIRKRYWMETPNKLREYIPEYDGIYWELMEYPIKDNKVKLTGLKRHLENA